MTIQRQYSLPNCTLMLEGLGDMTAMTAADPRPLMSMLINAECHLPGQDRPLSGGRDFLESLIAAVNQYAQAFLSHVAAIVTPAPTQPIQFQRLGENLHRLVHRPVDVPPDTGIAAHLSREVDLTTVQLFDLVEAIDQLLADTRTLPDLTLNLAPLSRRSVRSAEPVAKRTVPVAIGASSLAAAAVALSFLPVPQVRQPQDLFPKPATAARTDPPDAAASPPATPPSPNAGNTGSPSPTISPSPSLAQLEARLTAAPEISDPDTVARLRQGLFDKIDTAWVTRSPVTQDLTYRVGVSQAGEILGYKPITPIALDEAKKTPLLDLIALPTASPPPAEPIAQYKVVFTGTGVLEVAPWKQVMASPTGSSPEITDTPQLEAILPKLRRQLLANWQTDQPSYERDLEYRVRVTADGTVLDYEPANQPGRDAVQDTPLPKLSKPADDSRPAPEPYAIFRVVFRPRGSVEISPWRGWR